ncbi:MAG: CdaR family protein, partial [Armatimonadota bacterium]
MTAIMGWVRHNFWYKIASLALALVLWTYVVSSEPLVEEVIRVRVVPVNLAEGLQIVSVEPDNVPVSVRARRNLLSAIRRGVHPLELRADLSGRNEPGTHRVGLELVGLPRGASGTLSEHLFANIVVDKVVTRTWTIDDVRQGYPAGGFTVDSI